MEIFGKTLKTTLAALQKRATHTCSTCDGELNNNKEELIFSLVQTNQQVLDSILHATRNVA